MLIPLLYHKKSLNIAIHGENMSRSEERRLKKMKRMTLFPILMLMVVTTAVIGLILYGIKYSNEWYIINSKISYGSLITEKVCDNILHSEINSEADMNSYYLQLQGLVPECKGITIERNGNTIYSVGKSLPGKNFGYQMEDYNVILTTDDNSALFDIIKHNFSVSHTISLVEKYGISSHLSRSERNNAVQYQDIWYKKVYNKTTVYCCEQVPVTAGDLLLLGSTGMALHAVSCIISLVVIFIIIRVIHSQKNVLRAYYTDRETGGTNWYYFAAHVGNRTNKWFFNDKNKSRAIVQIRIEKLAYLLSYYGEKETNALIFDMHKTIKKELPSNALLSRYDQADFAIYFPYEYDHELNLRIEDLLKKLTSLRKDTALTFKAGIYSIDPGEVFDVSEAYNCASIARQNAENSYDHDVCFFSSTMKKDVYWEKKMENDLAAGIENNEFKVFLQPKVSCDSEEMVAAEALVRWEHPTEGLLSPFKFIDIFEKSGQIVKLDDYMISNVARIQSELIKEGKKTVPISVNISRIHFAKADLAEHICSLVDEYQIPHNLIEIELTESAFFDDKDAIIRTANKLRECDFDVSLDDFGSGYSSLNSLRHIPVDIVKLDSGFFRGDDMDGNGTTIISEVISLAKQLNKKIVAEGIEDRTQVDFLKEAGCDFIQGYYFAKPMPVDDFIRNYQ